MMKGFMKKKNIMIYVIIVLLAEIVVCAIIYERTKYQETITAKQDAEYNEAVQSEISDNTNLIPEYLDIINANKSLTVVSGNLTTTISTNDLSKLNDMRKLQPVLYSKLSSLNTNISANFSYRYIVSAGDIKISVNDGGSAICQISKASVIPDNIRRSDILTLATMDDLNITRTKEDNSRITNIITDNNVQIITNMLSSDAVKSKIYDKVRQNMTKDMENFGFKDVHVELTDTMNNGAQPVVNIDILNDKTK